MGSATVAVQVSALSSGSQTFGDILCIAFRNNKKLRKSETQQFDRADTRWFLVSYIPGGRPL